MSVATVHEFARLMPRLRAEEAMFGANTIAVGTNVLTEEGRKSWVRDRNDEIQGPRTGPRVMDMEAHFAQLAASGFTVNIVDADGKEIEGDIPQGRSG